MIISLNFLENKKRTENRWNCKWSEFGNKCMEKILSITSQENLSQSVIGMDAIMVKESSIVINYRDFFIFYSRAIFIRPTFWMYEFNWWLHFIVIIYHWSLYFSPTRNATNHVLETLHDCVNYCHSFYIIYKCLIHFLSLTNKAN